MNRGSDSRSWYGALIRLQEQSTLRPLVEDGSVNATYLSDVDEPTHKVLVAEGINRLLGLFSCSVFHNPGPSQSLRVEVQFMNIPASLHDPRTESPSVNPTSFNQKQNRKIQPLRIGAHLRHSIRK